MVYPLVDSSGVYHLLCVMYQQNDLVGDLGDAIIDGNGHFVMAMAYHFLGDESSFKQYYEKAINKSSTSVEREFFKKMLNNL